MTGSGLGPAQEARWPGGAEPGHIDAGLGDHVLGGAPPHFSRPYGGAQPHHGLTGKSGATGEGAGQLRAWSLRRHW